MSTIDRIDFKVANIPASLCIAGCSQREQEYCADKLKHFDIVGAGYIKFGVNIQLILNV